eukprot:SAG31_NODE_358_length_17033_cov_11.747077_5_plen_229_part_00
MFSGFVFSKKRKSIHGQWEDRYDAAWRSDPDRLSRTGYADIGQVRCISPLSSFSGPIVCPAQIQSSRSRVCSRSRVTVCASDWEYQPTNLIGPPGGGADRRRLDLLRSCSWAREANLARPCTGIIFITTHTSSLSKSYSFNKPSNTRSIASTCRACASPTTARRPPQLMTRAATGWTRASCQFSPQPPGRHVPPSVPGGLPSSPPGLMGVQICYIPRKSGPGSGGSGA